MPVKKEVTKKTAVKAKVAEVKSEVKKTVAPKATGLSIPVYSLLGATSGTLDLPKEVFGVKVNKKLLSQAMRVYMTNQKIFSASTKTRGEVEGSTAKIFKQKGTGRARHGAIRAPIFVGGGIVFGPKPRKVKLELPQRMKRAALLSALSAKVVEENVLGLSGLEKVTKTKQIAELLGKISGKDTKRKTALIVTYGKTDNVVKAARNIPGLNTISADLINAYEVLKYELLLLTKEGIEKLEGTEKK